MANLMEYTMTKEEEELEELVEEQVANLFEGEYYLRFCVQDEEDKLISDLNKTFAEGKCIFTRTPITYFSGPGREVYVSRFIDNPKWSDVCIFANEAIVKTDDYHHIYLELVNLITTNPDTGTKVYEFHFGS